MALPCDATAPDGWRVRHDAALLERLTGGSQSTQFLESVSSLRFTDRSRRVFRVRDFSSIGASKGFLEQLLRSSNEFDLALHVHVVSGAKGQRLAARAVHRMGSDEATTRSAGFRRTARSAQGLERLRQRESSVASGRALIKIAAFIVIEASSLTQLKARSQQVWRDAEHVGLRLERGWGSQALWFRAQIPGGGQW